MRRQLLAWGVLAALAVNSQASRVEGETSAPTLARVLVHATSRTTWIYPEPRPSSRPLGYLRAGHSLAVRDATAVRGTGCLQGWVAVVPSGFICLDRASLGGEPRYSRALRETLGNAGPLDFEFAWSNGAPAFRRLPSPSEAALRERPFGKMGRALPDASGSRERHALLAAVAPTAFAALPWFLRDDGSARLAGERELVREIVPQGSLIAYTRRFAAAGRDWLLRTDGSVVAAERMRPFRRSRFHGERLQGALQLPVFWLRDEDAQKYIVRAGVAQPEAGSWTRRSVVALDPQHRAITLARQRYLRTRETARDGSPLYVLARSATVVTDGVTPPADVGPEGKWLQFSISKGTLVAYEGKRAVFSTLASPGLGGVPTPGDDPTRHSTTPLGTFRISVKHLSDDMGPSVGAEPRPNFAEVPYAQYFDMPFAIHVAYWHESFGQPMSGGCINVSPLDGQYLFGWTLPSLPQGWDAVVAGGEHGLGTLVHVVR